MSFSGTFSIYWIFPCWMLYMVVLCTFVWIYVELMQHVLNHVYCLCLQRYPIKVDSLESIGELGFGSCGHVMRMRHKESGTILAVKVSHPNQGLFKWLEFTNLHVGFMQITGNNFPLQIWLADSGNRQIFQTIFCTLLWRKAATQNISCIAVV